MVSQEISQPPITRIILKISWTTHIKFHANLPGANELKKHMNLPEQDIAVNDSRADQYYCVYCMEDLDLTVHDWCQDRDAWVWNLLLIACIKWLNCRLAVHKYSWVIKCTICIYKSYVHVWPIIEHTSVRSFVFLSWIIHHMSFCI